jgi:hypothetical protein
MSSDSATATPETITEYRVIVFFGELKFTSEWTDRHPVAENLLVQFQQNPNLTAHMDEREREVMV